MPRYSYYCSSCKECFEITHSYKEIIEVCSLCNTSGNIRKNLSAPISIPTKNSLGKKRIAVGDHVNNSIIDNKNELKKQKEELLKKSKK
jgi:hypothetical protein